MAENNTNKIVMYLSIVVVVLLVAFVAVVIVFSGGSKTASVATTPGTGTSATTSTGTSQPGLAPSTATAFDPATATKVPASSDPAKFVTTYYQSILDKKWDVAFKMQPAASQVGQTVAAFQQTQEQMYGMTSFKIFSSKAGDTTATVTVQQELGKNGTWTAIWSFVKDKGTWLVQARKVNMGAPAAGQ